MTEGSSRFLSLFLSSFLSRSLAPLLGRFLSRLSGRCSISTASRSTWRPRPVEHRFCAEGLRPSRRAPPSTNLPACGCASGVLRGWGRGDSWPDLTVLRFRVRPHRRKRHKLRLVRLRCQHRIGAGAGREAVSWTAAGLSLLRPGVAGADAPVVEQSARGAFRRGVAVQVPGDAVGKEQAQHKGQYSDVALHEVLLFGVPLTIGEDQ